MPSSSSFDHLRFHNLLLSGDTSAAQTLFETSMARDLDRFGNTPLMIAAAVGCLDTVQRLLPHSDPNASSAQGATALMAAAYAGRPDTVRFLLPHCDANAQNLWGFNALMCAIDAAKFDLISVLAPETDLSASNSNGCDALSMAMVKLEQLPDVAQALHFLLPGCSPTRQPALNAPTSLQMALERKNWPVVDLFLTAMDRNEALEVANTLHEARIPQFHALLEAEALREAIEIGVGGDAEIQTATKNEMEANMKAKSKIEFTNDARLAPPPRRL